ncbi:MAG: butyrate kinase, partial [Coriobacteriaceae bacterium]|nr:butyrate kinase [Coriobacteriaceae bacterium]
KIGVYCGDEREFVDTIRYNPEDLAKFETFFDQLDMRERDISQRVFAAGYQPEDFDAVVTRGPICKAIDAGTYEINKALIEDGKTIGGHHPVVLGPIVAKRIGRGLNIPAYTVDPSTVDQLTDISRISGLADIPRTTTWQPLNHRQIGRMWAAEHGTTYEESDLIIAHMGGGTTVAAHKHGRAVDVNNGTEGEGPMTPERCGSVQLCQIVELCFSGKYTKEELLRKIRHESGVMSYLGTSDMRVVERRALEEGDDYAKHILDALCYQVAKEIASMYAPLECHCDAILLTGGLAYSEYVVEKIKKYIGGIAPVCVYPGEDEIFALAQGVLRVMRGQEEVKIYE